ncbi:hypothetical protein DSO57_1018552 [Entomophthora muscae]|uniref:Uncharacterized protein n=1 Tax=Entomophthora muscae TaxID=34485 RepID=A0ACC2ST33_9FUNG|nr:hypothetical protein DSO57_1018552 [Entomophthora muscae]
MGVSLHNSNNVIIAKRKQIRARYLAKKASRKASEPKDILRGRQPSSKKLKKIAQRKMLTERAIAQIVNLPAKALAKTPTYVTDSDKMEV